MSSEQALLLGVVGLAGTGLLVVWLIAEGRHQDRERVGFRLHFPLDVSEDAVIATLRAVAGLPGGRQVMIRSIVFETISRDGQIEHWLHVGFSTGVCFPWIAPATCANDVPLETVVNRSAPMACGPNVDQACPACGGSGAPRRGPGLARETPAGCPDK